MRDGQARNRVLIIAALAASCACALAIAACGSSGNTYTSPSTVVKCAVAFEAPASTLPAGGGSSAIGVKTERECQWSAQPDVQWLTIASGASGQGEGTIQFTAAANADPVTRNGGIMVNGLRAQVTQAAAECVITLADASASFPQTGGSGRVDVRASSPLCTWTAASDVEWISITAGANGKGSAPVAFSVEPATGPPRTGAIKIAGLAYTVTQSEGCTFAIAPSTYSAGAAGGSGSVTVTAGAGCPWTASSNVPWITITAGASGNGPGAVTFTVAATTGPSRTGTLVVAGQTVTVSQGQGCTFAISPDSRTIPSSGGSGDVSVTAGDGCAWTASSNQSWISIASGASGSGNGTVRFSVASTSGPARSGSLTIAGHTFTVNQGQGCTFAISPDNQSIPAAGASGTVAVTAGAGCPWTAISNQSWISITSGASGSGDGTVRFTVAPTSGPGRSGTMTIAGRTFTVNQGPGCTFSLSSGSATVPAAGGTGSFDVRSASGCGWSASSGAGWVTVTAGESGSGNGTVRYSVAANGGPQRSTTIIAGGQTFTVTQDAGCSFSISPPSHNAATAGGTTSVAVTAGAGCTWTASSNASWIGISSGASGTGNGTVQIVVAANTGADRRGTVTIAGQTFTVDQVSGCTFSLSPSSGTLPAAGGGGSFNVTTGVTCAWTATTADGWITITSGASGTGPGTVQFTGAANTGPVRTGTITVGGQAFAIAQESGCAATVAPDPVVVPAAGATPDLTVSTAAGCAWSAASGTPWIGIRSGASGSGNGTVQLDVAANTGPARSGTVTIAGRIVAVNQETGCTFAIAPTTQAAAVGGGSGSIAVTAGAGCAWTAVSNASWLIVTSGGSGTGDGTVQFTVDPNATGAARSSTITVAGQTFTVHQAGTF